MITWISRWFEPATRKSGYSSRHYALLFVLLTAGTWLRFWGLGNVGLHGDEETMALPAMAILEQGGPYLPSGMFYARAPVHTYMMAGSAWLFGESEWAFRLPSAIVGSLSCLIAFFLGRRFLEPAHNLAFVATVALLPVMIEISQTARMYVFWVTSLMLFTIFLFRWEADERPTSLILALLMWALALQFHALSIFLAPLFLYPGLSRGSWRQLGMGIIACLTTATIFKFMAAWIGRHYPTDTERPPDVTDDVRQSSLAHLFDGHEWLVVATIVAIAIVSSVIFLRAARQHGARVTLPIAFVSAGLLGLALLHYHIGSIVLLAGALFWLRNRELDRRWLLWLLLIAAMIMAAHLAILHGSGLYPGRKMIGALTGLPSVWPVLRLAEISPAAGLVYFTALIAAAATLARGKPIPMHFLFFAIGVWAPLLAIGLFRWNVPSRYALGQLPGFLLCVFAAMPFLLRESLGRFSIRSRFQGVALLALVTIALVNPISLARTVNPDYSMYPDHKGAAEYIASLRLGPDAILVAEDVIQQTYYLGRVDYWLREIDNAGKYCVVRDDQLLDQYTATPLLGTGSELVSLMDGSSDRPMYIIGSGEDFANGVRFFRGSGIQEVLDSERLQAVFEGRDGKTKVWKVVR